jgi:HEAT repeat protein
MPKLMSEVNLPHCEHLTVEQIVQKVHQQTLAQAEIAVQQGDWAQLSHCLQKLLLGMDNQLPLTPMSEDISVLDQLLDWALQGLIAGDFPDRWELTKVFPALGSSAILPLLHLLQAEDTETEVQWFALRILGQLPHPDVLPALLNCLKTAEDEELKQMAITVLASFGEAAIPGLGELLQLDALRLPATQALAQIQQGKTLPWLSSVVTDRDPQVRSTAIAALGNFPHPQILPLLLAALQDEVASVRQEAVRGLGHWNRSGVDRVTPLQPLLRDPDRAVCQQAAIALSRVGTPTAATVLYAALQSPLPTAPLTRELVQALGWIGNASALSYLHQALCELSLEPAIQQDILMIFGRAETPELQAQATQILVDVLQADAPLGRSAIAQQTIAHSLGELAHPAALEPLIQLLAKPDEGVRLHVIAALKHFDQAYLRLKALAQQTTLNAALKDGIAIALQEWPASGLRTK